MLKRRLVLCSLSLVTAGLIGLSGCEPPNIIDAAEPGVDPRSRFEAKEDSAPEALGETTIAAKGKAAEPQITTNAPPSLPTEKGETKTTPAGVVYETLAPGTGDTVKAGDPIKIHYTGTLENGKKFDSSRDRGQPFSVVIGTSRVIKGWDEGIPGMKIGERRKLTIPPNAAYGALGKKPEIPPNATLIFDVELMGIDGK